MGHMQLVRQNTCSTSKGAKNKSPRWHDTSEGVEEETLDEIDDIMPDADEAS